MYILAEQHQQRIVSLMRRLRWNGEQTMRTALKTLVQLNNWRGTQLASIEESLADMPFPPGVNTPAEQVEYLRNMLDEDDETPGLFLDFDTLPLGYAPPVEVKPRSLEVLADKLAALAEEYNIHIIAFGNMEVFDDDAH